MEIPDRKPDFTYIDGATKEEYWIEEGVGVETTLHRTVYSIKVENGVLYWRHKDFHKKWTEESESVNKKYQEWLEKTFYKALEEEIQR